MLFFFNFWSLKPGSGMDPDPDPYWSPASTSGSGSGSGKNEYGSETLAENYQPVIELYQTADHPALSPKSGGSPWPRVAVSHLFGGFCSTMLKTRQKNPPIDWEVGEGGRYACGLAWLIFTMDIVFWWFLQTYMTSGHCSCWFLLVIEQRIFWHYLGF